MEPRWAQVIDVEILRKVTEWVLPGLSCPCCGTVTFAGPPPGLHAGAVSYGPALNAAAVLLSCYGNVPAERASRVIAMLLGTEVSAGWVDKAAARVSAQLRAAGFDDAMIAALTAEDVLAADETPVNVLDKTAPRPAPGETGDSDPEEKDGKDAAGAPHVLIVRTPDGRLTYLQAIGSRRKDSVGGGIPPLFSGYLMTDGYTGYQHLLTRIAGIQQCCQHVIRRARAVMKLGPGGVQNWAALALALLLVIGVFTLAGGVAAITGSHLLVTSVHYVSGGLRAWGWAMTILGAVQLLAAGGVWAGSQLARWFAVAAVGLSAIGQLFFIPAYPLGSLLIIAVEVVGLWGLCAYGGRENLGAA